MPLRVAIRRGTQREEVTLAEHEAIEITTPQGDTYSVLWDRQRQYLTVRNNSGGPIVIHPHVTNHIGLSNPERSK